MEDLLIVKSNIMLRQSDQIRLHDGILEQRPSGVIVLPAYCEAILVPEDVEIRFEERKP